MKTSTIKFWLSFTTCAALLSATALYANDSLNKSNNSAGSKIRLNLTNCFSK